MPVTTTALALLYAGNTALNAISSESAAAGAKKQGAYEAGILEQDAGFADQQAADSLAIGKDQESRHMLEVRKLIGEERTTLAGSGIDISSGTARDIQGDSAYLGELDRQTIENNAKREAWGYKVQATDLRNRAQLTRMGASNAAAGYRNQTYSTLIGGAMAVGSLYGGGGSTSTKTPRASTTVTPRPIPTTSPFTRPSN